MTQDFTPDTLARLRDRKRSVTGATRAERQAMENRIVRQHVEPREKTHRTAQINFRARAETIAEIEQWMKDETAQQGRKVLRAEMLEILADAYRSQRDQPKKRGK